MARTTTAKRNKTLEQRLWEAADELRGNQEPSEYKHPVLGLVFVKYISDAFVSRRVELELELCNEESADCIPNAERREKLLELREEYTGHNVFWVPEEASWDSRQSKAVLPEIGQLIDKAMDSIEMENPSLRGVLPRNYGSEELDKTRLGSLVDLIGSIGFTETEDHGSDDVLGHAYEYFLGQFAGRGLARTPTRSTRRVWWFEYSLRCLSHTRAESMTLLADLAACLSSRLSSLRLTILRPCLCVPTAPNVSRKRSI